MKILKSIVFMAVLMASARAASVHGKALPVVDVVSRCHSLMVSTTDSFGAAASGAPQDVSDFLKSKPGAAPSSESKVTETENEVIKATVISATDASGKADELNAVRAANTKLRKMERAGTQPIATGSGLGVVAYGTASYSTKGSNPNLIAIGQRFASVEAHLNALAELAKFFGNLSVEGKQEFAKGISILDTMDHSLANVEKMASESYKTAINALVRGAVVFDYHDDPAEGEVAVSVCTSPKLSGAMQSTGHVALTAQSIEEGLAYVLKEIELSVIPPVGGKFVHVPATGQFFWIGFGSAYARSNSNKEIERELRSAADKSALERSRVALLGIIAGSAIQSEDGLNEKYESLNKQFDELTGAAKQQEEAMASASSLVKSKVSGMTKGELPKGVITNQYENGRWRYAIAMYNPEMKLAAERLSKVMAENSPLDVKPREVSGGFKVNPDGSFKTDEKGNLIPESLGSGQVTKRSDL